MVQIIGATARGLGFKGYPGQLYDIEINLKYGAEYIRRLKLQYPDERDIISAYNQGQPFKTPAGFYKNQEYVNTVLKKKRELDLWY